jgi:Winged helix DNA-binding domain
MPKQSIGGATAPVLTARALNRALLARQLLLERSTLDIEAAVEQVGGLQTQYAPSGYVGLWTRLASFERADLTRGLEEHVVVQATLMRATIHIVSAREFWRYAAGVREARREWLLRADKDVDTAAYDALAARAREILADGPHPAKDLGDLSGGYLARLGVWIDLVRVPPSGTWERRRADRLALAESWIGSDDASRAEGLAHVVRAYLRAFGPASWRDICSWAGISLADAKAGAEGIDLVRYRDEAGGELIDLPGAPLPDPETPVPVRFLPHWDANLLVHVRRTGLLPEAYRPRVFSVKNPFSVGTVLVDGRVVAGWSVREGRVVLDPYEDLPARIAREVEQEREALEAFHA